MILTGEERDTYIRSRLGHWQRVLRVQDIDVRYVPNVQAEDGANASMDHWLMNSVGILRVSPHEVDSVALDRLICHEVLHLLVDPIDKEFSPLEPLLPKPTWSLAVVNARDTAHVAIERIVTALTGLPYIVAANSDDALYRDAFPAPESP